MNGLADSRRRLAPDVLSSPCRFTSCPLGIICLRIRINGKMLDLAEIILFSTQAVRVRYYSHIPENCARVRGQPTFACFLLNTQYVVNVWKCVEV